MNNSNKKKSNQLGMPIGTAQAILKKNILYNLLVRFNLNKCYQCENTIDKVEGCYSFSDRVTLYATMNLIRGR